jgi:hypothetical protein
MRNPNTNMPLAFSGGRHVRAKLYGNESSFSPEKSFVISPSGLGLRIHGQRIIHCQELVYSTWAVNRFNMTSRAGLCPVCARTVSRMHGRMAEDFPLDALSTRCARVSPSWHVCSTCYNRAGKLILARLSPRRHIAPNRKMHAAAREVRWFVTNLHTRWQSIDLFLQGSRIQVWFVPGVALGVEMGNGGMQGRHATSYMYLLGGSSWTAH